MHRYSTNWMGPVTLQWYEERGINADEEHWAGGRIDVYGGEDDYPEEIGLPIMHGQDYARFSDWLDDFKTETLWTLDELVAEYEKVNLKIRWAEEL